MNEWIVKQEHIALGKSKSKQTNNISFLLQLININFPISIVHNAQCKACPLWCCDGLRIVSIEMGGGNIVPLFAWWINAINWYIRPNENVKCLCIYCCDRNSPLKYFHKLMFDLQDSHSRITHWFVIFNKFRIILISDSVNMTMDTYRLNLECI